MSYDGGGMEFKLTGWGAVVAIVIAVAVFGWQIFFGQKALDEKAKERIKFELSSEYLRNQMPEIEAIASGAEGSEERMKEILSLVKQENIEFTSIKAKGRNKDIVVKVEIKVNGGPPPDGKSVRYYKMSYSQMFGWRFEREVGKLSYWLKLY